MCQKRGKFLFQFKNPLVTASAEIQKGGIERLDERTVHQHMDVGEEFFAFRVLKELFVGVARIAPDVHPRALADGFQYREKLFRVEEGVTSRESHSVEQRIGIDFLNHLLQHLRCEWFPGPRIPGFRVVAALATVAASGQVDGVPDALSVDNGFWIRV